MPHDREIDTQTFCVQVYSVSAVAEHLLIDRKTVRKFMRQTDFCSPVPVVTPHASKRDPYKEVTGGWLTDDIHQWYEQRHTVQRICDRLTEEFPGRSNDGISRPGDAQVHFRRDRTRMHFLLRAGLVSISAAT